MSQSSLLMLWMDENTSQQSNDKSLMKENLQLLFHSTTDTFLSKIPIAPCYCQMMGRTLKEEIRITQYNNPTKAGKYSLEDLFRASDNIPHHYPKF